MITRRTLLAGGTAGTALALAACTARPLPPDATEPPKVDPAKHQVISRTPTTHLSIPAGAPGTLAATRGLLAAATAVVVAPAADATAPRVARELGLPLLVDDPGLPAELDRLQTRTVIAYGPAPATLGAREVVPGPATAAEVKLPGLPAKAAKVDALCLSAGEVTPAVLTTLAAVGLAPTPIPAPHPGVDHATTELVRKHKGLVVGVGNGFGTDAQFAGQVEVTRTGPELPGGGIVPFPGRRMVALYGHPATPALGMMGEQPPAAAVRRLKEYVDQYAKLWPNDKVIGAFEIITTVATGAPTPDGDYSAETPIADLLPWIEEAETNDLYVVLDLQPGRTDFLTQAKRYEELLRRPWVGLALDPEWRLPPNGKHLVQVGQVDVAEVNKVGHWLADLVAENKLPPKVLTLHQFQSRMITNRRRLDTSRPEIQYLVHVDGQGGQGAKQGTWSVIKKDLPPHVWLGWKNFVDEDLPMLTPRQTVEQVHPAPHFVSYQ